MMIVPSTSTAKTSGRSGKTFCIVASVASGPHRVLGDPRDPRNGWRNVLAIRKRDQARMRVRDCVADLGPADFKEMPSGRRGRRLAVHDQHLKLRERFGA